MKTKVASHFFAAANEPTWVIINPSTGAQVLLHDLKKQPSSHSIFNLARSSNSPGWTVRSPTITHVYLQLQHGGLSEMLRQNLLS